MFFSFVCRYLNLSDNFSFHFCLFPFSSPIFYVWSFHLIISVSLPQLHANKQHIILFIFFNFFFPSRHARHFLLDSSFSDAKISKKVSQSAALSVIKTHKNFVGNHQTGASMSNAAGTTMASPSSANASAAASTAPTIATTGKSHGKSEQSEKCHVNVDGCN